MGDGGALETIEIHISSVNLRNPRASGTKPFHLPLEASPDGPCIVPRPSGYTQLQLPLFLIWESKCLSFLIGPPADLPQPLSF